MLQKLPSTTLLLAAAAITACGGEDGNGGITEPTGSISITLGSSTISMTQDESHTVLVSVSRSNGFAGSVNLALTGAPSGVSGSFSPASVPAGSTSSTLTLDASGSAATGTHDLVVRGSAQGVAESTASLGVEVLEAAAYDLTVSPTAVTLSPERTSEATVLISRTNFTGAVELSVSGTPNGVDVTVSPSTVTGSSAAIGIAASAAAEPGDYTVTLTGTTAQLGDRTATLEITVSGSDLSLETPPDLRIEVGQPFSLALMASGGIGPLTFSSVGAPLPDGLELDAETGEISGTPSVAALLAGTPPGIVEGVVIEVSGTDGSARTDPFTIEVGGAMLPMPYAYMPFDGNDVDDVLGRAGTALGNVATGQVGLIGESVFVGGTNSRIRYPQSLSSHLNGKSGFTFAGTLRTPSTGTMFFGLSDQSLYYNRVYGGLSGGRIEFGGRSARREVEPFKTTISPTRIDDGEFHTVVATIDLPGDRVSIYLDGELDHSATVPFNRDTYETFTPANESFIGHMSLYADTDTAPNVNHDEVALWDVVLNEYQAATIRWLILMEFTIGGWVGF